MKIRTDFVTNSSSSSFVTIRFKNPTIQEFLAKHNLKKLFSKVENCWEWEIVNVILTQSFSEGLCSLLKKYLDDFAYNMNADDEDAIRELVDMLKKNPSQIDFNTQGIIEIGEACGEDGFGFYQKLVYKDQQGKLIKWPSKDGESYDSEFSRRVFDGEIEELKDLAYNTIWDIVMDSNALSVAVEATGKVTEFKLEEPKPEALKQEDDTISEGTGWIENKIFVLTGLEEDEEAEIVGLIESNGGEVKSSTVLKTEYLIYNPDYGRETVKMKKAKELIEKGKPVQLLTKQQFWKKVGPKVDAEPDFSVVPTTAEECDKLFKGRASVRDGVYVIWDVKEPAAKVIIPGTIDGLPVFIGGHFCDNNNKLETLIFSEGVIGFEGDCFLNCKRLKNVTLSSTIKKFGSSSIFYKSPWLKQQGDWLIINNILVRYLGEDSEVVIPYGVEEIGDYAVSCNFVRKVTIPDTVRKIGTCAFSMSDITEIDVPESVVEFGTTPFGNTKLECNQDGWLVINGVLCGAGDNYKYGDALSSNPVIEFPQGVHTIGGGVFCTEKMKHITTVILPDGLREIGKGLFGYFEKLTDIRFPDSLKKIGDGAFKNCKSLKSLHLPDGLKEIGSRAFEGCESLESMHLPDGLQKIGSYAFSGCVSLEEAVLPDSVTVLGDYIFARSCNGRMKQLTSVRLPANIKYIPGGFLQKVKSLTQIELPEGVLEIQDDAFEKCECLKSISIPEGLVSIGSRVFYGCTALSEIRLPDSVRNFAWATFKRCTSLKEITIPEGVEELPMDLFKHCTALERVTLPATVTKIHKSVFDDCPDLTVYASSGSYAEHFSKENGIKFEII